MAHTPDNELSRSLRNLPEAGDALASPLRMEVLGLFTDGRSLSIADMAARMGRRPVSLYHHVGLLEQAGLLRRAGSRRVGKRDATLFELTHSPLTLDGDPSDPATRTQIRRVMSSAFRMAERDLEAAVDGPQLPPMEGPERTFLTARVHVRASPEWLARLNGHLSAIERMLGEPPGSDLPGPDDVHVSLTLALLPMRGRDAAGSLGHSKRNQTPETERPRERRSTRTNRGGRKG